MNVPALSNTTVWWSGWVGKSAAKVQAVHLHVQAQEQNQRSDEGRNWHLHPLYLSWPFLCSSDPFVLLLSLFFWSLCSLGPSPAPTSACVELQVLDSVTEIIFVKHIETLVTDMRRDTYIHAHKDWKLHKETCWITHPTAWSFPPTLLCSDLCLPKVALVLPRDCRLPRILFRFQNCAGCTSAAELQFQPRILTLGLTERLVTVDWSLCAGLCGLGKKWVPRAKMLSWHNQLKPKVNISSICHESQNCEHQMPVHRALSELFLRIRHMRGLILLDLQILHSLLLEFGLLCWPLQSNICSLAPNRDLRTGVTEDWRNDLGAISILT